MRPTWNDLPRTVRAAIEAETGPVSRVEVPAAGRNSDFAATLFTQRGAVFCKGIVDAEGNEERCTATKRTSPRICLRW
ncbi:hypothetical protein [Amycolatopsis sp. NPDC051071]|uniref:hypothetical protein n=1 Tax=Amycolatopsis sp. NPDC051071 TaxID=3154637 RepID=UPI0034315F94